MLQWAYAVFSFALNLAIWDNSSSNTNKALVSRESFGSKTFPYHFAMPQTMLWKLYSSTNLSCRLVGNLCIIFWGTAEAILAEFKVIRETLWQFTPITPLLSPPPSPPPKKKQNKTPENIAVTPKLGISCRYIICDKERVSEGWIWSSLTASFWN